MPSTKADRAARQQRLPDGATDLLGDGRTHRSPNRCRGSALGGTRHAGERR